MSCGTFTDNIDNRCQPHLSARGARLILMAAAPQSEIEVLRQRFGWSVPWYSCGGTTFNEDLGLTAFGRQEQWEDSPAGWPQDPTMGWLRLRDEY